MLPCFLASLLPCFLIFLDYWNPCSLTTLSPTPPVSPQPRTKGRRAAHAHAHARHPVLHREKRARRRPSPPAAAAAAGGGLLLAAAALAMREGLGHGKLKLCIHTSVGTWEPRPPRRQVARAAAWVGSSSGLGFDHAATTIMMNEGGGGGQSTRPCLLRRQGLCPPFLMMTTMMMHATTILGCGGIPGKRKADDE